MDLSKNQLTAIPVALGNFTELKQLNAEHNEIGRLCVQQAISSILFNHALKWKQSQVKIQGGYQQEPPTTWLYQL
jgi:Leucine-rich repeat (LRR) protein